MFLGDRLTFAALLRGSEGLEETSPLEMKWGGGEGWQGVGKDSLYLYVSGCWEMWLGLASGFSCMGVWVGMQWAGGNWSCWVLGCCLGNSVGGFLVSYPGPFG